MAELNLLEILACGEPILRRRAREVSPEEIRTPAVQDLIERMRATMYAAPGVGLAAPQVGEDLQLAVLEDGPERWGHLTEADRLIREREELPFTVLVNPTYEVVGAGANVAFYEGCLSVPGLTGLVSRHQIVRVSALDQQGEPLERVFSGWPARIAQHEIDHLEGTLYLDRVETRSLSTLENFAQLWAGHPVGEVARGLGFPIR